MAYRIGYLESPGRTSTQDTDIDSKFTKKGKVPFDWKSGNIVSIYKGENQEEPTNYRPVSLTIALVKLFENILKDECVKYLDEVKSSQNIKSALGESRLASGKQPARVSSLSNYKEALGEEDHVSRTCKASIQGQ